MHLLTAQVNGDAFATTLARRRVKPRPQGATSGRAGRAEEHKRSREHTSHAPHHEISDQV